MFLLRLDAHKRLMLLWQCLLVLVQIYCFQGLVSQSMNFVLHFGILKSGTLIYSLSKVGRLILMPLRPLPIRTPLHWLLSTQGIHVEMCTAISISRRLVISSKNHVYCTYKSSYFVLFSFYLTDVVY